jgi:hypothetical protein
MADFVLRKADRWLEVEGIETAITSDMIDIRALWEAAGRGRFGEIVWMLDDAGIFPEDIEITEVVGVRLIAVPDDIHGTAHRLWLRRRADPQDWSPRKR